MPHKGCPTPPRALLSQEFAHDYRKRVRDLFELLSGSSGRLRKPVNFRHDLCLAPGILLLPAVSDVGRRVASFTRERLRWRILGHRVLSRLDLAPVDVGRTTARRVRSESRCCSSRSTASRASARRSAASRTARTSSAALSRRTPPREAAVTSPAARNVLRVREMALCPTSCPATRAACVCSASARLRTT